MAQAVSEIISFLNEQNIIVSPCIPEPCYISTDVDLSTWPRFASFAPTKEKLRMSLASMIAAEQICPKPGESVLDLCAAPGMKSLYLSLVEPKAILYCNDVSRLRLERMRRLHEQYGVKAVYSLKDASSAIYQKLQFDKVLVDAPCSGEGVALAGSTEMTESWSVKKVHRLQQLQYRILKQAWKSLRPGGVLIYSTCTLNRYENEIVIKKALKIRLEITEEQLQRDCKEVLISNNRALRILPSARSIGFFIAKMEKPKEYNGSLLEDEYLID